MKIALLNSFAPEVKSQLSILDYSLVGEENLQEVNAIVLRSKSLHEFAPNNRLLAVARAGAGVNNIPVERFTENGIAVFNAPGANANAVAEMVLTSILMQIRKVKPALEFTGRLFSEDLADYSQALEKGKSHFQGKELTSLRLGVIGLGAIGVLLANKAAALGMTVLGFDPHISVENAWRLSSEVEQKNDLQSLLSESDCVSVHVPYLPATHHLLNRENLKSLPLGANLFNFSRAEVVDEVALLEGLNTDRLEGYITDFPNKNLMSHPKVLCFPHLGASTQEAQSNASQQVIETLDAFLKRGEIRFSVNLPNIQCGPIPQGASRLVMIHCNTVGMIAKITDCVEALSENILEMNNRSRGDYAVTVMDLAAPFNEALLNRVKSIEKMLSVRYC